MGIHSSKPNNNNIEEKKDTINEDSIKKYVKELLKDNKINSSIIPDVLEERIYEDILGKIVEILKQVLTNAKIELLGQEIHFIIVPKVTNKD